MKLTKQLKAKILEVYNAYWNSYLKGDVRGITSLLADDYTQVGSAETEVFDTRRGAVKFLRDTIDQVAGKLEMRNRTTQIEPQGNLVLVHEFCDVYVLAEGDWIFYSKFRASTLMQKRRGGWKIIHQHSSFPDARTGEGDNIATEKIAAENRQLREAVRRRTVELEQKNRELEIETALEKVRAIAMGMKKPGDMLEVCRAISLQLQSLGVEEIRNVQTAIFHESRGTYMNYEYYTRHKKTIITETTYTNHKVHKAFATKMLKGKGEVFITHIKGKKVKDWIAYQKTTNVFIDRFLEKASSLNYYWHSLGPVALGISTYAPLGKEELALFQRFLNVFELAYTRYLDIEQALSRALEARIEASLEKVRSRSMSMHRSDELVEAADVVFRQLKKLGIESIRTGIATFDAKEETVTVWSRAHADSTKKILGVVPRKSHPFFVECFDAWMAKKKFYSREFVGSEVAKYYRHMSSILSYPVLETYNQKEVFYTFFFPEGSVNVIRHERLTDEELSIMQRFARVFGLMYRRFLDLQKAEAQARESQIQLALERVRARTMAMQKSDELQDAAIVLFQQIKLLGVQSGSCGFNIWNKKERTATVWMSSAEGGLQAPFDMRLTESPIYRPVGAAMKKGDEFLVEEVEGKNLLKHFDYLLTLPGIGDTIKHLRKTGYVFPKRMVYHFAFFNNGYLSFHTHEPYPEAHDIFKRFARVFEQTYTRFLDLQKAEAQAREAQIEAALERVRSRSMGMQKSEELKEVIRVVYQQLTHLKIKLDHSGLVVDYAPGGDWHFWIADEQDIPSKITHPYFESVWANQFNEAKEKGRDFFATHLTFEEKNKFYNELLSYVPGLPEASKEFYLNCPGLAASTVLLDDVGLYIENFSGIPYSEEENYTLMRFGKVFQQTYTRFLDLQKAEAQAREAKIEAALERARTQSMIMQHSKELDDTLRVFHEQVLLLGINSAFSFLWLPDEEKDRHVFWAAWAEDNSRSFKSKAINYPLDRNEPATAQCFVDWKSDEPVHSYTIPPAGVENYFAAWSELFADAERLRPRYFKHGLYYVEAFMKYGCFGVMIEKELSADEQRVLGRFAIEFERAYTRFLDLQKAEAQAREAQIEASLERIRARAMAMHTSDELGDVAGILREQMGLLGQPELETSVIDLFEEGSDLVVSWYAFRPPELSAGKIITGTASFLWTSSALTIEMMEAYRSGRKEYMMEAESDKAMELFRVLANAAPEIARYVGDDVPERVYYHLAFFSGGALLMVSYRPPSEESKSLQRRAASVFDMAYRRYLDLKKAEAQAREAQIEAAMERVRSKAMAMHTSTDLSATVGAVFAELRKLGVNPIRAGVALYSHERRAPTFYATTTAGKDASLAIKGSPDPSTNPCLALQYEAWHKKQDYSPVLEGEELKAYYAALSLGPPVHADPNRPFQHKEYGYYLPFSEGNFYAWSEKPCTEDEVNLLNRFKTIIDLTFRRYLDLQKAEAQARESQIEASLERVRSRTLAMQKSDELAETAAVLFRQLITLGIEPNRLYIAIMKDESGNAEFWITDEDGSKVSSGFTANMHSNITLRMMLQGWQEGKKSIAIDMQGKELQEYFQYLGSLNVPFKGGLSQTRRIQNIAYFSRGFIGIASPEEQPEETTALLERFAAVFNLTLTRFNDLKLAEAQAHQAHLDLIQLQTEKKRAEDALSELSATQAQLVQQEKLASLGQLTAGIAHEIKNPLNFVNNFSSVSVELVDEAMEEIKKLSGGDGEAQHLLDDVKKNLNKIIEHGTRADGIVKSMLQHSRGGSGKKEPGDLNALVKEYVNLAFHGMRAAKNPINVDIVLELEQSIGKVPVIAEDFSRVIINLCQNAFDAMREKFNAGGNKSGAYLPKLTVRTRREADKIIVEVGDNGPGIPDAIKDKILQPFFTTKKGTQGTGLGLSITHDIVKVHGGSLSIESAEDTGTIFRVAIPSNV